ncbi:MAG: EAL domain-containing protein [Sedimenticola sp.]
MYTTERKIQQFIHESVVLMTLLCVVVWTTLVGYSLYWNISNIEEQTRTLATAEARSNWNKDAAFRRWTSQHGSFYIVATEHTQKSPYLAHLPHRDIVTTDGTELTLMSPAYMMRRMTEEFEDLYGVKGKITGKITLNPINTPDPWELAALNRFEEDPGLTEVMEESTIKGLPFLRFIKPMYMTEGCVKCHGILGFKDGDLRGGVSVSIPMAPYLAAAADSISGMKITHSAVWITGILGFLSFGIFIKYRQKERRILLKQLEHDALYDTLTQLPNRLLFSDRVTQAIHKRQRGGSYQFAVCFIDLDRFKSINDGYGHATGDELLRQVSQRLSQAIRPSDTIARNSGDEFTVLLDGITGLKDAVYITERLQETLKKPFSLSVCRLNIDASFGICIANNTHTDSDSIIQDADTAMYRAKASGSARIDIFDPDMHAEIQYLTRMEHDLKQALDKEQFEVYYQPVISLKENCVIGFEALLRWHHPDSGMVSPEIFIPIAEDTGSISRIGAWVLAQACRQTRDWNLSYKPEKPFTIAVNLSSRQVIKNDISEEISNILSRTRLEPSLLHVELTETMMVTDRPITIQNLSDIKALGVSLHADDFGKGYSSLTYLQEYNFDTLKIDKDFVQDMGPHGKGRKLVKALLLLAQDLEIGVVAEGIETQEQFERLSALHCNQMQGYYLCPPLTASAIEATLNQNGHLSIIRLLELNPFLQEQAAVLT